MGDRHPHLDADLYSDAAIADPYPVGRIEIGEPIAINNVLRGYGSFRASFESC